MSNYKTNITESNGSFYMLVVRTQSNGFGGTEEVVVRGTGKHYATRKNAERAGAKFIAKVAA